MITNEEFFDSFHSDKSRLPGQGDWILDKDKLVGTVYKNRDSSWFFRHEKFPEFNEYFSIKTYGEARAKELAEENQIKLNKKYDLSDNAYRYLDEATVEAKLDKNYTMVIDSSSRALELLKCGTWWTQVTQTSVYALAEPSGSMIRFHKELMEKKEGFSIDHINGTLITRTILDNRISNLRHATQKQQSNNVAMLISNTSGVNGVHLLTKRPHWRVKYQKNGVEKFKHFGFGPQSRMTKEKALEAATKFRQQEDAKNGCTNGVRPNLDLKKRKQSEESQEERLAKRVTTTTTTRTITEYFASSNSDNNNVQEIDDEVEMITE